MVKRNDKGTTWGHHADVTEVGTVPGLPRAQLYRPNVVLAGTDADHIVAVTNIPPGHHADGLVTRPVMPTTAFGELDVAEATPIFQTDFVYGGPHPQLHRQTTAVSGTVTYASNMVACAGGATALGLGSLSSRRPLKYRPGQGALARFTALYSTPSDGSVQAVGLSNGESGLLIGHFFSTSFGVWRQSGGAREIQTLTVTGGATSAGNVTILLEGVTVNVAVTNVGAGNTTRTAWEIAAGDFSTVNSVGWDAFAEGSTVIFVRRQTGNATGTFSFSAGTTGAAASIAETVAGVSTTSTFVPQASFSVDPLDGTGPSGMTLDPTKGNVFQITFQYLGFGEIIFWIESSEDGQFFPFHEISYPNANTVPSLTNPSITWSISSYNLSGGADHNKTVKSASCYLATQGNRVSPIIAYSATTSRSALGASRVPIISIKMAQVLGGRLNLTEAIMRSASVGVEATKPVRFEIVINGTLNNLANFTLPSSNTSSCVLVDTSATTITGGFTKLAFTSAKTGTQLLNLLSTGELFMGRFDTISLVATPAAASTDIDASLSWFEDQ